MSLPSIKELLVDLKDLGNVVHNIKGSFPFSLNEKQEASFEQQWMDIDFDSAFFSDLDKKALLKYSEDDTVAEGKNADDVNNMLEEAPTALGDAESNQFRKGVEGVYRLMNDVKPVTSKVESAGLDYSTNIKFNNVAFTSMELFVPAIEKALVQAFNLQNPAINAAQVNNVVAPANNPAPVNVVNPVQPVHHVNPANPAVAKNAPDFSHRNHYPQKIILSKDDLLANLDDADVAHLFNQFEDKITADDLDAALDSFVDDDAIKALLADIEIPSDEAVEQLPPSVPARDDVTLEVIKQTPPPVPPRDDVTDDAMQPSDDGEIDEEAIRALLADFNVDADDLVVDQTASQDDVVVDISTPVVEKAVDVKVEDTKSADSELAPLVPAHVDSEDDEIDESAIQDLLNDLNISSDILAVEETDLVANSDRAEEASIEAPVVTDVVAATEAAPKPSYLDALKQLFGFGPAVDSDDSDDSDDSEEQIEELLEKAGITIEEAVDVEAPVTVNNSPVAAVEDTEVAKVVPVAVVEDTEVAKVVPVATVEDTEVADQVNMDAINDLLGEMGVNVELASVPANIPVPPPMPSKIPVPPPMPGNGALPSKKVASTIQPTEEAAPKAAPKVQAPVFAIGADEFAKQRDLIKAKAAEKAAAKLANGADDVVLEPTPAKKASSFLEEALAKAFDSKPVSKHLVEETKATASSSSNDAPELDDWELEQLQEDNAALIAARVRAKALTFDLNGLVNEMLVTKQAAIGAVADNYEQKLHALPCVTKLSAVNQDNVILANGIVEATNNLQHKLVEAIKTHAMAVALGVIQSDLQTKMKIQFPVDKLLVDIDRQELDEALTEALQKLDADVLEQIRTDVVKGMDEMIASDVAYLETGKQPSMFDVHCKNGVEKIAQALDSDRQALVKIIEAEGLEPVADKAPVDNGNSGGGLFAFLANHLIGRRNGLDDTNDKDNDTDAEPSKKPAPVEADKVHSSSPFGFQALKTLMGEKLGAKSDSDSTKESDDSDQVDHDAIDSLVGALSPVSSGYLSVDDKGSDDSKVDHDAIDSLMGVISPVSSGYLSVEASGSDDSTIDQGAIDSLMDMLSPVNSGYLSTDTVINQSDVLQGGGVHDVSSSHQDIVGAVSPVIMQQLHETPSGDVFSPF